MTVPPPFACGCVSLCDDCVAEQFAQLRGVAQSRGETWARGVADVIPIDRAWPHTERTRVIALRKIADLTRDERLRELLASEVELGAARWWNRARRVGSYPNQGDELLGWSEHWADQR